MRASEGHVWAVHVLLLALLFSIQFVLPDYHHMNVARIMVYAIFATGYNVLLGYTGLMSLGHALFFAAGAYGAGLPVYWLELNPALALLSGIVAAIGVSFIAGFLPCES